MTTKNMKRVTFYLDSETQAIIEKIPPFFKSFAVRNAIKKAALEGWLDAPGRNVNMIGSVIPVPKPDGDSPETAPPLDKSNCRSFRHLKRVLGQTIPPQPRISRPYQMPSHLRRMEGAVRNVMTSLKYPDPGQQQEQEGPKSLNELPMCEVLGERPHADRRTCASCIAKCPH